MTRLANAAWLVVALMFGYAQVAKAADKAADTKKIERVWKSKCSSCHGADGKAATEQGKKMGIRDMSTAAYQKEVTDEQMKKAITEGVKREKDGKKQEMEAFADLKPEQVDGLVTLIRSFKK